ncbi:hypothetical protein ACO22_05396 [Paracoccidioides brasiliensis]|uniref:Secreted protein n=1 Tax=Paracoccidioides brasiliensis TaxID=121759 RepID=A0A1D2JAG8_PARBR|nr:hypothetical protein ACO22_05396 [Paracoccidioides brasiliensis]
MVLFLPLSVRHSRKSVAGLEFTWLPRYYYNIVGSGPMDCARSPSLKGTSDRLSDQAGMADRKGIPGATWDEGSGEVHLNLEPLLEMLLAVDHLHAPRVLKCSMSPSFEATFSSTTAITPGLETTLQSNMKYLSLLFLLPLASAVALPNPFPESEEVSPAGVHIRGVFYGGSGCKQGSLDIEVDDHGTKCPIRTKDLYAVGGPDTSYPDRRRFCQLNFDLIYPQGWSFSILGAEYKGRVSLQKDSTAWFKTTYYFSGETSQVSLLTISSSAYPMPLESIVTDAAQQKPQAVSRMDFTGPTSKDFEAQDMVVWDTWSPCGNTQTLLNVKQEVSVRGTGKLASTSTEGQFGHAVIFKWKRC